MHCSFIFAMCWHTNHDLNYRVYHRPNPTAKWDQARQCMILWNLPEGDHSKWRRSIQESIHHRIPLQQEHTEAICKRCNAKSAQHCILPTHAALPKHHVAHLWQISRFCSGLHSHFRTHRSKFFLILRESQRQFFRSFPNISILIWKLKFQS